MSIFAVTLPKILEISEISSKNFENVVKNALQEFDKFEEEYKNGRRTAQDKTQKDKIPTTTLQSINEDDDEIKTQNTDKTNNNDKKASMDTGSRRRSKKRSKDEAEDILSPEQDKRQKRNASVKAQSVISKQVNVNLTQKMRREDSTEKTRGRRRKDEDKENALPVLPVNIKQEKVSLPLETMDVESLSLDTVVKQERDKDDFAMPPPVAPIPKPRKALQKEKSTVQEDKSEETSDDETGPGKRRTTRPKKYLDSMPPPPVPSARSTRASSRASCRATKQADSDDIPPEPRPKRTRAKKKVSDAAVEPEAESAPPLENGIGSPVEKSRPKRTRRGRKKSAATEPEIPEKEQKSLEKAPEFVSTKEENLSQPEPGSPVLQKDLKLTKKSKKIPVPVKKTTNKNKEKLPNAVETEDVVDNLVLDETRVLEKVNGTVSVSNCMDNTMVIPNGVYNHSPVSPRNVCNATVVLEKCDRPTMLLDKLNDATMVIDKADRKSKNVTDDNSLLTDDNSDHDNAYTPPKPVSKQQPSSAVKEKVQQFEELAARTTRTKTRAMAKMDDQDNHTPPDKMIKPVLSAESLTKMNNMIFNGKAPQVSVSASKPRVPSAKPQLPSTTSKLSSMQRYKEAAEESVRNEKEDARKKKEAMLEAKRELQKKKREDKMAAAAAAREAAERERKLAMEAAVRERMEKQAHADQGKLVRMKEVERKKLELARKVAETEERRKAEEQARQQKLAEEQKKADASRKKQLEEAEAMKKEAAMAKEIEKKQKEYLEKQKMKHNDKIHTPLKYPGTPGFYPQEPVYMQDGFEFLISDEEDDSVQRPLPSWSTSKTRKVTLVVQSDVSSVHIDKLFSVRVHSPDLREIFPTIERSRLKRTSSAVWRTPPRLPPVTE